MPIRDVCVREVVHTAGDITVHTAAQLMRQYHVGTLVVTDESSGERVPVGVVTDRDIVLGVVAAGLDPEVITVGDLMGPELATIHEDQSVFEALERMRQKGVRRMPVVNSAGALRGILAVDDVLGLIAQEMGEMAKLIDREQGREVRTRK